MRRIHMSTINRRANAFVAVLATMLIAAPTMPVSATPSPVSVTLSPSSGSVQQGATVQVTVNVTTSGTVSSAVVGVNYDATRLTFQSADYSGVSLDQDFGSGNSAGRFTIDRYKLGGPFPTGTFAVAKLTFVSGGSGSATLSVDSASTSVYSGDPADNGDTHTPLTAGSTSITINAPAPAPANPPAASAPTTPPKTVPKSPSGTPIQQPVVSAETPDDEPIATESQAGNIGHGYVVELRFLDKDSKPRENAEVKLGDSTERTDKDGIVSFVGVAPGSYEVEIDGDKRSISVVAGDNTEVQRIDVAPEEPVSSLVRLLVVYGIPIAALVLVLTLGLLFQKKRPIFARGNSAKSTSSSVGDNDFMKDAKQSAMEIVAPSDVRVPKPSEVFEPTENNGQSTNKK